MAIQPQQPQTIGGVLDTTFQLYKGSLLQVWPICLLLVIVSSPPSIYMVMQGGANPQDPLAAMALITSWEYWLVNIIAVILAIWAVAALYLKQRAIGAGEQMSTGAALQSALGHMLPLTAFWILYGIAVLIGLMLLAIPGLILMISLMLGANLLLFEGKGPIASLTGSHALVWGAWWRTAAILTVGFIIVMVIYMAAGILIGVILPFAVSDVGDISASLMLSSLLLSAVMNFLLTPFYVALVIAIYWDLKLRKEGGDLAARVGALDPA